MRRMYGWRARTVTSTGLNAAKDRDARGGKTPTRCSPVLRLRAATMPGGTTAPPVGPYAIALVICAMKLFSASLTFSPPNPRKPPLDAALATPSATELIQPR